MLKGSAIVDLVNAIVPLYLSIGLGFVAAKYRILPYELNYTGIGGFAGKFAIPFLLFRMVATNDPYHMNLKLLVADTLCKLAVLSVLCLSCFYRPSHQHLAWVSSLFSLATMPNNVLIGVSILPAFYPGTAKDITTLVFMQCLVWYSVCVLLLEIYKAVYENSTDFQVERERRLELLELKEKVLAVGADEKSRLSSPSAFEVFEIQIRGSISNTPSEKAATIEKQDDDSNTTPDEQVVSLTVKDRQQLQTAEARHSGSAGDFLIQKRQEAAALAAVEDMKANYAEEGVEKVSKRHVGMKIAKTVLYKFVWGPTVWGSLLGFIYSLINFRFNDGKPMPTSFRSLVDLIGNCTLGLCMFMLGMNMTTTRKLLACGLPKALLGAAVRFIVAPAIMAVFSFGIGLRGEIFRFAVVQAMMPQAIVMFVWANQYNVHVALFSTAVWFQTLTFFPFAIALDLLLSLGS